MHALIKKLHIYAGLFSFTALVIYGVAGLDATAAPPPEQREAPEPVAEFRDFTPPGGAGDKAVADAVHALLKPPLAGPIPASAVHRNASNDLQLDFYSPNGVTRVTVLETEQRLRIERNRVPVWRFFNNIHGMTLGDRETFPPAALELVQRSRPLAAHRHGTLRRLPLAGFAPWVAPGAAHLRRRIGGISDPLRGHEVNMYLLLRNTHLLTGLFGCLFVLLYGLRAVQMAHNAWFAMTPRLIAR
jgi:hypothetical protein